MITRKEIRTLSSQDLLKFRLAMEEIQKTGSYYKFADFHGARKNYCHRTSNDLVFLAWHRYYIYSLEQELLKVDPTVSLPYWDWTDKKVFKDPLAPAHADKTYTDSTGTVKDNPLFSAFVEDHRHKTFRKAVPSEDTLIKIRSSVDIALKKSKNLLDLNNSLAGPHNSIHSEIDGTFGTTERAAYDPLFWSHHAAVDRQWAIWQENNPNDKVPDELNAAFDTIGFPGIKVSDVIDYQKQLNYGYDNLIFNSDIDYVPVVLSIVKISTIEHPFSIDVFLIKPGTNEKINAGYFGIFGMGKMQMNHGMHHSTTFDEYLDITKAIKKINIAPERIDPLKHILFEIHDKDGNKVSPDILRFEKIFIDQLR